MDLGIAGKRALVMGGNRGIGLGIAHALVAEGVRVAITGRDEGRLAQAAQGLRASASSDDAVATFALELADTMALPAFADEVTNAFGPIDILANNTGGPAYGGAAGHDAQTWSASFRDMVLPVLTLTDAFLPGMRQRGWGRVMTVVSSGVVQPIPILGISNTMRNALVTWSKTLAAEVARDGVTVNVLVPGRIDTERVRLTDEAVARRDGVTPEDARLRSASTIPLGRYGSPAEFGALAAFVAGKPAAYITGSMLRCDGGSIRSV
jgi:3-oxoacyl-[acyl-carrier protein] reductase